MRVAPEAKYTELRDALSQDWQEFMTFALPEVNWMPLPNLGPDIAEYIEAWKLDGLLLTSGNDLGENDRKDATDFAALDFAIANQIPVFGICRGMQVVHVHFGGDLTRCPAEYHVCKSHPVSISDPSVKSLVGISGMTVNSYHNFGIRATGVPSALLPFATSGDWVEGFRDRTGIVTAVMWHPERDRPFSDWDRKIIRWAFGL